MSNNRLYDSTAPGNHSVAFQHGPTIPFRDSETRASMYVQTWRILAGTMNPLPIGAYGPRGGWLIEETQPSHLGCGVLEWQRTYTYLPPSRFSGQTVVYNLQQILTSIVDGSKSILEFPITTSALVRLDYFARADPSTIPQLRAWKATITNGVLRFLGTPPDGKLALAEDSRIREWKPFIYERSAIYVTAASFAPAP